jgi:hypothetical protein
MSKQDTQLKELTEAIHKLLEREVAPVAPVAPVLPLAPIQNSGDHDLIVILDTKLTQIQLDVTELKKQNTVYVNQTDHAEVVRVQRVHDTDIEKLKFISIQKEKQEEFESKINKIDIVSSNFWIYLTLYSIALGALYVLIVYHILQK